MRSVEARGWGRFVPHLNVWLAQTGIARGLNRRPPARTPRQNRNGAARMVLVYAIGARPFRRGDAFRGSRNRREKTAGNRDRASTTDSGRFNVPRARLAPAMISTPGHRASRRRQRGASPAWSLLPAGARRCRPEVVDMWDTAIIEQRNFAIEHDLA